MSLKAKFFAALATGLIGLVAALPWDNIVSAQTAALILSTAGAAGAVLTALKIVPKS